MKECNFLQTYEIFLKLMYLSLLKELYDQANRLTNRYMEGEFESKTPEQLTTTNFSYINRDLVGAKQELVKYEALPEKIILDTSARSYVYKFSGTKEIRAIELYPESKVHRVRERDIHIYVKENTEDAWKEVRNWKFNKDEKNGKLSFVFKEAVSASSVKVRSSWDDRNKENVCIDDYSTFKGKPNNLLRIWTLENILAEEYSYDGNSNRISLTENGSGFSYEYYKNTQGGNTAKVKYDGKWYYTYDANGNRTEKAKALISGVADKNKEYWTYEWDLWNRLVKVVQYNAPDEGKCVQVSYEYDALNHRISRTSGTETTKYAYGRNGALAYQEKTVDGSVTKRSFTYLNNEIVGFTDSSNNEETAYYTVTDIQGSITEVYDGSSKLVWKSGYTAFGELAGETVDLIDFDGMYTGCDYDAETGLTYHWNRWRSEDGSAFISEDPARDGANWYGYAGCNPMVYVDRIGLAQSNDYLAPGVAGPQPKPQNQENGFVPLVQNPSGMPQNQTPNITGPTGMPEVVLPNQPYDKNTINKFKNSSAQEQLNFLRNEYNSVQGDSIPNQTRGQKAKQIRTLRNFMDLNGLFKLDENFMNTDLRDFLNLKEDGTMNYKKEELIKENGWTELCSIGSQYHQTEAGDNNNLNAKFVNKDGREVVINKDGKISLSYPDKGTFNYKNGSIFSSILWGGHKLYDMKPYDSFMSASGIQTIKKYNGIFAGGAWYGNSHYW